MTAKLRANHTQFFRESQGEDEISYKKLIHLINFLRSWSDRIGIIRGF